MNDEGVRRLCAAVVEQSCKDYASALYRLKRNPRSYQSQRTVSERERFLIQYADYYCGIEGKSIVRRIQEEVGKRLEEKKIAKRTVGRKPKEEGISKWIH